MIALDCSRNCTTGTLNAACDACTCDHHVLTGRVMTVDDSPLSEANISLAETPYNVITQTNVSGYFTTFGVCADEQELLVTKEGYVPVRRIGNVTTATTATITAKLEIAGTVCMPRLTLTLSLLPTLLPSIASFVQLFILSFFLSFELYRSTSQVRARVKFESQVKFESI